MSLHHKAAESKQWKLDLDQERELLLDTAAG
jgi:hypothetical protein